MSMSEVIERKARIDAAIGRHDPALFTDALQAWLEATAFLRSLPNLRRLGIEPKAIPSFDPADLRDVSVRKEADDAVMGFCIAAGLARDKGAFVALDRLMTGQFGIIYPGSSALYHCNQIIDPVVTLDDAVGQVIKNLLAGAVFSAQELWNGGLRFLQRLRSSNFNAALMPLLADWLRREWAAAIAKPLKLAHWEMSVPKIAACLADGHADQAFVAALLAAGASALEEPIAPDYLIQLAKLAERA